MIVLDALLIFAFGLMVGFGLAIYLGPSK